MGKKVWIIVIIVLALIVLAGAYTYKSLTPKKVYNNADDTPTIKVTYTNFASILQENPIVQALPSGAVLEVRFYNYNTGERTFEKSFVMKTSSVKELDLTNQNILSGNITETADITILIHSKYLQELTNKNFCEVIQKAKANGDTGTETTLSPLALAWKFKSMMAYKSCLGL